MQSNQNPPYFYELFIFCSGRIGRATFLKSMILVILTYFNCILLANYCELNSQNYYPCLNLIFGWCTFAITIKRLHDNNKSGYFLLWSLLPVVGPIYILYVLLRKRSSLVNSYGLRFEDVPYDYLTNVKLESKKNNLLIVDDVTCNNPIAVKNVITPTTNQEIIDKLINFKLPISISGGRFSMGGQTASPDTLHIDMRKMNKILEFAPLKKYIRVQVGIRWCDIQRFIDQFELSIKIMQTYANFTVGGSLSVNAHGRYIGQGPIILSVREIVLILADGKLITASPIENQEYFYSAIGGYGGVGIIVEAELDLTENINLERTQKKLSIDEYYKYFREHIRDNSMAVMHNGDIYPPGYKRVNAVTWEQTLKPTTTKTRLQVIKKIRLSYRYFLWAIAETPFGKWRREFIVDKLSYMGHKVHSKNYEASYDVSELTPIVTNKKFWELQEYFIPIEQFDQFTKLMKNILQRYNVNALNISIRHAKSDSGSYLAWAREEVFAFVLYFKQFYGEEAQTKVGIWTRELIDAVISCNGTYYLPYQIFATYEQFNRAYPDAQKFFEFKQHVDPTYRFRNKLWDTYYLPYFVKEIK